MDVLDFFDKDKPLVKIKVPGAQINGVLDTPKEDSPYEPPVHDKTHAYDYAQKYKDEEEAMCLEHATTVTKYSK